MNDSVLSVADIIKLMEALQKNGMGSLQYRQGNFSLSLEAPRPVAAPVPAVPAATAVSMAVAAPVPVVEEGPCDNKKLVTSPIVGTFYAAPSPDQPPFVAPGQQVKKGDVLFIIESMKLMNEVLCEMDGTVAEILVENAQAVEYGHPILRME